MKSMHAVFADFHICSKNRVAEKQLKKLEDAFRVLDIGNDGYITRSDLQTILKKEGYEKIEE